MTITEFIINELRANIYGEDITKELVELKDPDFSNIRLGL